MVAQAPHCLNPERKVPLVLDALESGYGRPRRPRRDPLTVFVRGVLSQNTSDTNSGRAYEALMERFGSWEAISRAAEAGIGQAIESGGLAAQKAATIRRILTSLRERGGFSLDYLKALPAEQAERELTAIKGVGVKTARLVLLFGFGVPVFVVDTHVLRVSRRLGLIPPNCTRQKAHVLLDGIVPDRRKYSAHMNIIRHGRETCHARRPACDGCPIRRWCCFVRA